MKKLYEAFLVFPRGKQIAIAVCLVHLLTVFAFFGHHLFSRRTAPPRAIAVRTIIPTEPKPQIAKREEVAPKPKTSPTAKPKAKPIAKIKKEAVETPKPKKRPALVVPAKIETKAPPVIESEIDPNYGEFLIAFLQNSLDLPEYGEVKAKLEIDRFGKLVRCEILEAKSAKNAEFLKTHLPELLFPYLNDFGIVDSTQTFTITFRNVETR